MAVAEASWCPDSCRAGKLDNAGVGRQAWVGVVNCSRVVCVVWFCVLTRARGWYGQAAMSASAVCYLGCSK